jgi:copper chaperone CopZ
MKTLWVFVGSLLAALVASVCCIGPIVLAALGLGAVGLAARLAPYRPFFLGATAALLGVAFYLSYRRSALACGEGAACTSPVRAGRRWLLWLVAVGVVAVAAFPNIIASLRVRHIPAFRGEALAAAPDQSGKTETVLLQITGMTCEACAGHIEAALARVPGVREARVSYQKAQAQVSFETGEVEIPQLKAAVERAGYKAGEAKSASGVARKIERGAP